MHQASLNVPIYKYVQINYRHLKCLWLEETNIAKLCVPPSPLEGHILLVGSTGNDSSSYRMVQEGWLCLRKSNLLLAEVCIVLPYLAWSTSDDCIAEHSDDHYKQEVAGIHQVQINKGAVILWNNNCKLRV